MASNETLPQSSAKGPHLTRRDFIKAATSTVATLVGSIGIGFLPAPNFKALIMEPSRDLKEVKKCDDTDPHTFSPIHISPIHTTVLVDSHGKFQRAVTPAFYDQQKLDEKVNMFTPWRATQPGKSQCPAGICEVSINGGDTITLPLEQMDKIVLSTNAPLTSNQPKGMRALYSLTSSDVILIWSDTGEIIAVDAPPTDIQKKRDEEKYTASTPEGFIGGKLPDHVYRQGCVVKTPDNKFSSKPLDMRNAVYVKI